MRIILAISLIAATVTLPATAQQRPAQPQRAVATRTACAASFADQRCASYQRRMIAVAARTAPASPEEAGKRQLEALLRTID